MHMELSSSLTLTLDHVHEEDFDMEFAICCRGGLE